MSKSGQSGFTLVELVVVIVILGILSAFAIPRFVAVEANARAASVQALGGGVRSSAALVHSLWLAGGATATSVTVEGQSVAIVNGYPSRDDLTRTLQNTDGFTYDATTGVFARQGAQSALDCSVSYSPPGSLNEGATIVIAAGDCS